MSKTMRQIDALKFDPTNARKHDERNIKAIMDSLERHGQRKPIVCYSNMVVAGNGTLQAAKRLGWAEIWVNDDGFKSIEDAKAYAIQDNRSAELAAWDDVQLGDTLTELKEAGWDLEKIGFNDDELKKLLEGDDETTKEINDLEPKNIFEVVVTCSDENEQESIYNLLIEQGLKCRVLSM